MARPRKPNAIHELTGAAARNPKRQRAREAKARAAAAVAAPAVPYVAFAPPAHLSPPARVTWLELAAGIGRSDLTFSERLNLEIAATLLAEFRAGSLPDCKISRLQSCTRQLGLTSTPVARSGSSGEQNIPAKYRHDPENIFHEHCEPDCPFCELEREHRPK